MSYKIVDMETYYRRGVFRHFSQDCKCSVSLTSRVDVTALKQYSKATGLEALFGAMYLLGRQNRLRELFSVIMEGTHAA